MLNLVGCNTYIGPVGYDWAENSSTNQLAQKILMNQSDCVNTYFDMKTLDLKTPDSFCERGLVDVKIFATFRALRVGRKFPHRVPDKLFLKIASPAASNRADSGPASASYPSLLTSPWPRLSAIRISTYHDPTSFPAFYRLFNL